MRVNGERIKQAREIRGLTQEQLAERVGVSQPYISLVEQSAETPAPSTLEAIALATSVQIAFFFRKSGPDLALGSLLYRRTKKLAKSDAARVRQQARLAIEVVEFLGRRFKPMPVVLPVANCEAGQAAQLARSAMGVSPDGPISGLLRKLEKSGVLVVYLPAKVKGFEAFSAWSDEDPRRPVVCLSSCDSGDRVRRTIAHELGHLILHQDFLGSERERDKEADIFAGELLFPSEAMDQELMPPITLTRLAELKRRWGVAMAAIAHYATERRLITARQKRYVRVKLRDRGWLRREPVAIPVEYPRLLTQMADSAFPAGEAPRRIAKETGLSQAFVAALLRANTPQPKELPPAGRLGQRASLLSFESARRARREASQTESGSKVTDMLDEA